MIRNYYELTRLEMEQLDRENTIVMIPLGATEQHGNQAPLGTGNPCRILGRSFELLRLDQL